MTAWDGEAPKSNDGEPPKSNLERLERYLKSIDVIPERNGAANLSLIALDAGIDRQFLYSEGRPGQQARKMLADAVAAKDVGLPNQVRVESNELPTWASNRIKWLEERLTVLRRELTAVRAELQRYRDLDAFLSETGKLPR